MAADVDLLYRKILAYRDNKDAVFPKLADLPTRWHAIPPDERDPDLPHASARDIQLRIYRNFASTKRWAWDGLNRLLADLLEREEPIPQVLADWACHVVVRTWKGELKTPRKQGNSPYASQDERDFLIVVRYYVLRGDGWRYRAVLESIEGTFDMPEGTIRSVFRKMHALASIGMAGIIDRPKGALPALLFRIM